MKKFCSTLFVLFLVCHCLMLKAQINIIPRPETLIQNAGQFTIKPTSVIAYTTADLKPAALYLQQSVERLTGYRLAVKQQKKGGLVLEKVPMTDYYRMTVDRNAVKISSSTYDGIVSAIGNVRQMIADKRLPAVEIVDNPRFGWRGFHLDCSRHFFTVEEVCEVIDLMAMYKLNRFHWHLTDDQGWRVEIKRYPELTSKGGWRVFNNQDSVCMRMAETEDNPDMLLPKDRIREVVSAEDGGKTQEMYGGFYSQEEITAVVDYALQRGIEIVPEIDMPGHMLTAIDCYSGLSCFEEAGWGKVFTSPLCPGKDKVLEFCRNVWDEVCQLFPFQYVHIGGDEVEKDNWKKCPDCQQRINDNNLSNEEELQSWFIHAMERYINSKGKRMIGWDEILEGGLSRTSTVMWWRTWEPTAVKRTLSQGNNVILTPMTPMYLSAKPEPNSIRQIYDYDVAQGNLTSDEMQNILGVQGNLWAEWIPTRSRMMYMYFPRIIALSELAWTKPEMKDYSDFELRLKEHYKMLHRLKVPYRIPDLQGFIDVTAFTDSATLSVSCDDPTATIRYTRDGSCPNNESPLYNGLLTVDETTLFTFRTFSPDGRGDEMKQVSYIKQGLLRPVQVSGNLNAGLKADWYDFKGNTCRKITQANYLGTYVVDDVSIPREAKGNIGLVITGYIDVPEDGVYTFSLMSDDGSLLKIDGNIVVDNDREQSPHEMIGQQALHAGKHRIDVRYFDYNGGMLRMNVVAPSGKQLVPQEIYCH